MLKLWNRTVLTDEQKQFWDDNGYLILRNFLSPKVIDAVNTEVDNLTRSRNRFPHVTVDILVGELAGRRMRIVDAPDHAFAGPIKINDLFLDSDIVRACNLDKRLVAALGELLDGDPLVCNSLNFLYGSQQDAHYDSWFMPPLVKDKMAVASICLDEANDENGPIVLYPGSHKIPPYVFPDGNIAALKFDLAPAVSYARETTRDIEPVAFHGKPGDVLLWHSQLLHGGSAIKDAKKTRRSLVTHYWRAQDVEPERAVKLTRKGYMLKREHQAV